MISIKERSIFIMDNNKNVQGVLGIHHLTAIAGNPQKNIDFYIGILGLRFSQTNSKL